MRFDPPYFACKTQLKTTLRINRTKLGFSFIHKPYRHVICLYNGFYNCHCLFGASKIEIVINHQFRDHVRNLGKPKYITKYTEWHIDESRFENDMDWFDRVNLDPYFFGLDCEN